jgi:hypothetical protein
MGNTGMQQQKEKSDTVKLEAAKWSDSLKGFN